MEWIQWFCLVRMIKFDIYNLFYVHELWNSPIFPPFSVSSVPDLVGMKGIGRLFSYCKQYNGMLLHVMRLSENIRYPKTMDHKSMYQNAVPIVIDWLIDWLIDWVLACLIACLLACLIDWLAAWSVDWVIDWLIDWLADWSNDWLSDWLIDWLFAWLIAWLIV